MQQWSQNRGSPPNTQEGCSELDDMIESSERKQQKLTSASRRPKLRICAGEAKTNTSKCQYISCIMWALQHATAPSQFEAISHTTPPQIVAKRKIFPRTSANFFFPPSRWKKKTCVWSSWTAV